MKTQIFIFENVNPSSLSDTVNAFIVSTNLQPENIKNIQYFFAFDSSDVKHFSVMLEVLADI